MCFTSDQHLCHCWTNHMQPKLSHAWESCSITFAFSMFQSHVISDIYFRISIFNFNRTSHCTVVLAEWISQASANSRWISRSVSKTSALRDGWRQLTGNPTVSWFAIIREGSKWIIINNIWTTSCPSWKCGNFSITVLKGVWVNTGQRGGTCQTNSRSSQMNSVDTKRWSTLGLNIRLKMIQKKLTPTKHHLNMNIDNEI